MRNDFAMPGDSDLKLTAPFAGIVVAVEHEAGGAVASGAVVVVLEAMKMEHEIVADVSAIVRSVAVAIGDSVGEGDLLVVLEAGDEAAVEGTNGAAPAAAEAAARDPEAVRADLAAVRERHALGWDAARPGAVARRREGLNMAAHGEIDDVIDPADSRRWIATLFDPPTEDWRRRAGKRRPNVDAW